MGERPRELGADSAPGGGAGAGYTEVSLRDKASGAISLPGAPPPFLEKSPRLLGHCGVRRGRKRLGLGLARPLPALGAPSSDLRPRPAPLAPWPTHNGIAHSPPARGQTTKRTDPS